MTLKKHGINNKDGPPSLKKKSTIMEVIESEKDSFATDSNMTNIKEEEPKEKVEERTVSNLSKEPSQKSKHSK